MKRLVRAYCEVCGETTTWEANDSGPLRCLDAEHLACLDGIPCQKLAPPRKLRLHKPFTILGFVKSLRTDD